MNELQDIAARLERVEAKTDAIFRSAEKTRRYFLGTLIITVATIVLPLIGMIFLIPYYLKTIDVSSFGL